MIGEAIDTAITLGVALLVWIVVAAAVGTVVLLGAAAGAAWAVKALWRRSAGPSWRRNAFRARILARRRVRPPQARTDDSDHTDYEEAA